jgi:hypothetical protein
LGIRLNGRSVWLEREGRFEHRLKAVHYNESPWRDHYPGFAHYLEERANPSSSHWGGKQLFQEAGMCKSLVLLLSAGSKASVVEKSML